MLFGGASGNVATLVANLLIPISLIVFATGFFPYKPFLPGLATFDTSDEERPPAMFDKVVFMVVDALRSDFVYSDASGFKFTQSLIQSGSALPFTAHASSPTITMPRVKAITTGSVPSFLDVILNFAESDTTSTLAHQDTWLAQIKAQGKGHLVMYGDDTWLKLFPGMFERADGTTSFFVSDFTEVDHNVTRHIPEELLRDDWSAMIMHYLGLDHIGHKAGPRSPHMIPKHEEMDSIVKDIYTAMETNQHLESTLLVLCGDHGMNDAGNHGGSSSGETSPALTFISPKLKAVQFDTQSNMAAVEEFQYYRTVEQSDIAPTLAALLGFPVPLNNLGVIIPEFLSLWEEGSQRLQILLENSKQILNVVRATFPNFNFDPTGSDETCSSSEDSATTQALECQWVLALKLAKSSASNKSLAPGAETALLAFSAAAQSLMSSTASNYDLPRLYLGIGLAGIATIIAAFVSAGPLYSGKGSGLYFLTVILSYGMMMFASSYVEEEQNFWYWIFSGWTFLLHVKTYGVIPKSSLGFLSSVILAGLWRLARRWNQTGQKFAAEPDISAGYFGQHTPTLWALILATYAYVGYKLIQRSRIKVSAVRILLPVVVSFVAFAFKVAFTWADSPELLEGVPLLAGLQELTAQFPLVLQARLVFLGIAAMLFSSIYLGSANKSETREAENFHDIMTLFLMTQSRSTNIPLFLIYSTQKEVLTSMDLSSIESIITSILLQYGSFFSFGGSNAISSVDLSSAYNGVGGYSVVVVGILTFVSNWAGPIWWVSATRDLFHGRDLARRLQWKQEYRVLSTLFTTSSLLAVMVACTVLRTHLFIWTVFSPKYLYIMAWGTAHHLVINMLCSRFLL